MAGIAGYIHLQGALSASQLECESIPKPVSMADSKEAEVLLGCPEPLPHCG